MAAAKEERRLNKDIVDAAEESSTVESAATVGDTTGERKPVREDTTKKPAAAEGHDEEKMTDIAMQLRIDETPEAMRGHLNNIKVGVVQAVEESMDVAEV